ncbi:MAG: hypothetical protein Pg6A_19690 [Termitinemataceae bacterium]|nr:MAG: hypothetical protein Pg6A_19690 [Termitinemataceae bacterium]
MNDIKAPGNPRVCCNYDAELCVNIDARDNTCQYYEQPQCSIDDCDYCCADKDECLLKGLE